MATTAILWGAATSRTTGIAGDTINNGAASLGSEIDNTANKDRFCSVELTFRENAAPAAGAPFYLYLLQALDGTNYEDGGTAVQPLKGPDGAFPASADNTTVHKITRRNIPIGPFKFKPLVWNATGQNSYASSVILLLYTHNEEIQA